MRINKNCNSLPLVVNIKCDSGTNPLVRRHSLISNVMSAKYFTSNILPSKYFPSNILAPWNCFKPRKELFTLWCANTGLANKKQQHKISQCSRSPMTQCQNSHRLQSGASGLAKHGGAYFSAIYGSLQDPIAAPGLFDIQVP